MTTTKHKCLYCKKPIQSEDYYFSEVEHSPSTGYCFHTFCRQEEERRNRRM